MALLNGTILYKSLYMRIVIGRYANSPPTIRFETRENGEWVMTDKMESDTASGFALELLKALFIPSKRG